MVVRKFLAAGLLIVSLGVLAALRPASEVAPVSVQGDPGSEPAVQSPPALTTPPANSTSQSDPSNAQSGLHYEISTVQKISDAAANYDEAAVRTIAPYLLNPNKDVRRIAVDALVRVGNASGATELKEAANKVGDPREASAFLDAADFLSLPTASAPAELPAGPSAAGEIRREGRR
jgi:hypothetical protein